MAFESYPALAICLALLVYVWNFVACGQARGKYGIEAPAVTGHPVFERQLRIQQNMVEQLIAFVPAIWIFGAYVSSFWAGVIGLVFVIGRVLYSLSYAADPKKRGPGFILGALSTLVLLVGGLIGVAIRLAQTGM